MSGPTTVFIIGDPVTALLAAAGIRAAEALYEGYARAEALRGENAEARAAAHAAEGAANRQGRAALEQEAQAAEARFEQLIQLSEQLGAATQVRATRPVRPASNELITLATYTRALQSLASELQGILRPMRRSAEHVSLHQPELMASAGAAIVAQIRQTPGASEALAVTLAQGARAAPGASAAAGAALQAASGDG